MTTDRPDKQALRKAAALVGGQAAMAGLLGYGDRRSVWPWFSVGRSIPPEHCPKLERETSKRGGLVTCEELRPDVPWCRIDDADWPWHPEGRPLIDVSRQPELNPQEVQRVG